MVEAGDSVWGVARRESELTVLQRRLGEGFRFSVLDVSQPERVADLGAAMAAEDFVPDAVVLNAGIYPHDSDDVFRYDVAERVLATNLDGVLGLVPLFLEPFLERGSGQFLAVSSVFALRPDPLGASYAASKAGLTMAFRSLALRYRGSGVRFKSMLLGPIETEGYRGHDRKRPSLGLHLRTADQAARAIRRALRGRRSVRTYPALLGLAFRMTSWLPDSAFNALTQPFRR